MLLCHCEGCGIQPEQICQFEIADAEGQKYVATLCMECFGMVNGLDASDPTSVAMSNRIADFKTEWPLKAELNYLHYASTFSESDPNKCVEMIQQWHRESRIIGIRKH